MIIRCHNCNRKMEFTELTVYTGACLIKQSGPLIADFVMPLLKAALIKSFQTRGPIENIMAGCANAFEIPCPQCKEAGWFPAEELENTESEEMKLK